MKLWGFRSSRGCPFGCEFCDIINLYGPKPRYKTPAQVVNELDAVYKLGWRDVIFICDDNFIGSRKHAVALLKDMDVWMKANASPFSFTTQASINLGQDIGTDRSYDPAKFLYCFHRTGISR